MSAEFAGSSLGETRAFELCDGPEDLQIRFEEAPSPTVPVAEFALLFHPCDQAEVLVFLRRHRTLHCAACSGAPGRMVVRMRWNESDEDFVLVCLEIPSCEEGAPCGDGHGSLIRLDTALDLASHTFERADITPTSCWSVDMRTGALSVAPSWKARLGYAPHELEPFTHAGWVEMSHPDDVAGFDGPEVQGRLARGELVQYVSRTRHRDGGWVTFLSFCRAARWNAAGEATLLMGCDLDMTAVSSLEGELARERDRLTAILDALPSGKMVLDAAGRIDFCNPEACALMGCGQSEAQGRRLLDVFDIIEGRDDLLAALDEPEGAGKVLLKTAGRQGAKMLQVDLAQFPASAGTRSLLLSLTDITMLHGLQMQLEQSIDNARFIATHDLMTGLPDRYLLMRLLGEALVSARAKALPLAVLCIDFDNYRLIIDTMGHETADQLIKSAAKRLEQGLPEGAVLARTGEGEFVVLLPAADALAAEARGWEIVRAFARPMRLQRRQCFLTVSVGIGAFPEGARSAEEILRNADMAMHQSKSRGRNTVTLFSAELGAEFERRTAVAQALHRALEDGSFTLHLQPKFEVDGEIKLVGAEALLRLTDAELGAISPAEFIPVAEVDGLVAAIDLEVMRLSGALLSSWAARGITLPLAVNLNATTLDEPGYADLAERLLRAGLDPARVTVELTETGLAAPVARRRRNLQRLCDAGYKIAVDDFGTGQSALGALQSLPVSELKVDRSFVRGLDGSEPDRARAIIRAILAMAGSLGLRAIAEGVETEAQFAILLAEGCTAMQGFLLGRPLDLHSFEARYLQPQARLRVVEPSSQRGTAP